MLGFINQIRAFRASEYRRRFYSSLLLFANIALTCLSQAFYCGGRHLLDPRFKRHPIVPTLPFPASATGFRDPHGGVRLLPGVQAA